MEASRKKKQKGRKSAMETVAVFDDEDDTGFVYSHNNGEGRPEFIALNVPRNKVPGVDGVAGVMKFLADRECKSAEGVRLGRFYFFLKEVTGQERCSLLKTHMRASNYISNHIFELIPLFEFDSPERWGMRPESPDGVEDMVDSIIHVWKDQGAFVFYRDGNPDNCSVDNQKYLDLAHALKHAKTAIVDWNEHLSPDQISYVRANIAYFRNIAKVLFRTPQCCRLCGEAGISKLSRCAGCNEVHYCCPEHQKADWASHKQNCKIMKHMKTRQFV